MSFNVLNHIVHKFIFGIFISERLPKPPLRRQKNAFERGKLYLKLIYCKISSFQHYKRVQINTKSF